MLKNYVVIAIRSFRRNKWLTFLNVTGLIISFLSVIGILLFVTDELSYDKHFAESDKIFRLIQVGEDMEHSSSMPFPAGPAFANDFQEDVAAYARIFNFQASTLSVLYENGSTRKLFNEPRFFFADSTFFQVFPMKFIKGNIETALSGPNLVVITASTAERYFGHDDPIGKILKFEGKQDLQVTAVIEDIPSNTHFKLDFVASFPTLQQLFDNGIPEKNWYWNPVWTYIKLKEPNRVSFIESKLGDFVKKYYHPSLQKAVLKLQPLTSIYLNSYTEFEIGVMSDGKYIYIFTLLGVAILCVAVINFMNLTTAYSSERFKEIAIRKVSGAERKSLIFQFISESVLLSLLSFVLASILLVLTLPLLNDLTGKSFSIISILDWRFLACTLVLSILIGIVSGYYPAFILASKNAIDVLKPATSPDTGRILLRKILVGFQFAVSILFMSGTIVSFLQLNYLKNASLGFDQEEIIIVPIQRTSLIPRYETFKKELLQNSSVKSVTTSNVIIGKDFQTSNYKRTGWDDPVMFPSTFVKGDFINTMGIKLIAGRDFSDDDKTEGGKAIINEPMMKALGWNNPDEAIGQEIDGTLEGKIKVIAVAEAFHYASLHQEAGPMVLININNGLGTFLMNFALVKINGANAPATIEFIKSKWQEMVPETLFSYSFLNENLNKAYEKEEKFSKLSTFFSIVAIVIGAIGLFGLTMFAVQRRRKEISIRKVLGGSSISILNLLTKEFFFLLAVAAVIAIPSAVYLMNMWLSSFAYQVSLNVYPFLVSVLFLILITTLIVAFLVLKTIRTNPANVLKSE